MTASRKTLSGNKLRDSRLVKNGLESVEPRVRPLYKLFTLPFARFILVNGLCLEKGQWVTPNLSTIISIFE